MFTECGYQVLFCSSKVPIGTIKISNLACEVYSSVKRGERHMSERQKSYQGLKLIYLLY
jgi:hypothetical protein